MVMVHGHISDPHDTTLTAIRELLLLARRPDAEFGILSVPEAVPHGLVVVVWSGGTTDQAEAEMSRLLLHP